MNHMKLRFALVVSLALCAQATLRASNTYDFGTIPTGSPENGVGISLGLENYTAGSWTETNINGVTTTAGNAGTNENIVCVVALLSATHVCGDPGPTTGAANIPITAPTGTPGGSVTNYLLIDGDSQWGAPVSADLTSLTPTDTYTVSFYQAATEELQPSGLPLTGATAYDDSWLAYLLPTSAAGGTYICPQAHCSANGGTVTPAPVGSTLAFNGNTNTLLMDDAAGSSTAWEQESFTFVASATTQFLEFVTNVAAGGTDAVIAAGTNFVPPMLALADVTVTQQGATTPEPGTWALTLLGAGLVFAGSKLRRKFSGRR
jgi:PEP-CTERM motif-containing protein